MNLLVTSASTTLAQSIAGDLAEGHQLRLTDCIPVDSTYEFARSDLGHDASTNLLVRGMDAVVHVARVLPDEAARETLDYLTRCTYNLLHAATEEGVRRVVLLSSIRLMAQYDPGFVVSEQWRPRSTTEPEMLGIDLCEIVCREYAREHKLQAVALRLGTVIDTGSVKATVDEEMVPLGDAVNAIERALMVDLPSWSVFHIVADVNNPRFPVKAAKETLGYEPAVI